MNYEYSMLPVLKLKPFFKVQINKQLGFRAAPLVLQPFSELYLSKMKQMYLSPCQTLGETVRSGNEGVVGKTCNLNSMQNICVKETLPGKCRNSCSSQSSQSSLFL